MSKSQLSKNALVQYACDHSLRLTAAQKGLIEETLHLPDADMMGSADELQLLANLCKLIGAKKALDIGTMTGYSALTIALSLPEDGKLVTCDLSDEDPNIGKPFWKQAGVDHKIDLRIAPAADTLQSLIDGGESGTYDFAFIDADKENYVTYFEMCLKLVRSGGIIAVDNVFWEGEVLNPAATDPYTMGIKTLNEKLRNDERVDISILTIADGVTLAFKR